MELIKTNTSESKNPKSVSLINKSTNSNGNVVNLSNNQQVVLPNTSTKVGNYSTKLSRLPQTGLSNGILSTIIGIVIAVLGLIGIDIKRKKI